MSTYGGDSWDREAQHRKRRVDDLLIEGIDPSIYKKLPNGKLCCIICPHNPILDTPIMLSTHVNGSRHRGAESRRKDTELAMQREINKRRAIDGKETRGKPLVDGARKAGSNEVFCGQITRNEVKSETVNMRKDCGGEERVGEVKSLDYRGRIERELKFTAAGWKRDGHGRWYKDENVEFDSDEEDPNVVLNGTT